MEKASRNITTVALLGAGGLILAGVGYRYRDALLADPLGYLPILGLLGGWYIGRPIIAGILNWMRSDSDVPLSEQFDIDGVGELPSVTVQLPAYNEEDNIEEVLASIRRQEYEGEMEVIVVDDGSTDATFDLLRGLSNEWEELRIATKENRGIAHTRNMALSMGTNDIIISMDSDTILEKGCVQALVREFLDEDVVGVAANVEALNDEETWWTRAQSIEYLVSMEMARMFQSKFRHLMVISGGCGAYRREIIERVGGWDKSNQRYAEDFHLTIQAHEYGRIAFTPEAIALTVVPTDFKGWWDQRMTWAGRGLRTVFANRHVLFNPKFSLLGIFALPFKLGVSGLLLYTIVRQAYELVASPSAIESIVSLMTGYSVALIATSGTALVLLGVVSSYANYHRPLRKYSILPLYLSVYRQFHVLVRFVAFNYTFYLMAVDAVRERFGDNDDQTGDDSHDVVFEWESNGGSAHEEGLESLQHNED